MSASASAHPLFLETPMSSQLTRKALYELVWSQPRTQIAKTMRVSDVWIGKQCRALNVPAPPPGYWAARAARGAGAKLPAKYQQPPLSYTVAERIQEDHDDLAAQLDALDLPNAPLPLPSAPVFEETVAAAVARYATFARQQVGRRRAVERYPVVQRLLDEDERRVALKQPSYFDKPLFRSAEGQATLAALDRIAGYWAACGFAVTCSGRHEVQFAVNTPAYARSFEISAAPKAPVSPVSPVSPAAARRGRPSSRVPLAFWLDHHTRDPRKKGKPDLVFDEVDTATLDALTDLLLTRCEESFRGHLVWRHEHIVQARMQAIRAAEEAERKAREAREAAVRALHLRRHRLLLKAIDRAGRAHEIRAWVAGMEASPGAAGLDVALLARWKAWAMQQADGLDLLVQDTGTLDAWLRGFELGD